MDDLFLALSLFRRRKFDECVEACTRLLNKNPQDEAAWVLKMKALNEQAYVDDVEPEEEGVAEIMMNDEAIAQVARPGTSLKAPGTGRGVPSQSIRPLTQSGRPISGVIRPGSQAGRPTTMEQAIKAPRTAFTSRPMTTASGRFLRLGTASMFSTPGGPFIDVSRLNIPKYALKPPVAKPLFEYLYYHENDIKNAFRLASEATQACQFKDWWWKVQIGKCYYRFGLIRDAEKHFQSSLKDQEMIEAVLWLGKTYLRMDQPLTALEVYNSHLERFVGETSLLVAIARIHEALNDLDSSARLYREVLLFDAINVEAIACIATHHFYADQPEVALRYYRRLLQMGIHNVEVFTNLGLCCFYAQQYDLTMTCFQRALALATDANIADVWYNISHIALGVGDINLAFQCLRLALVHDSDHSEAYNNLGVLEWKKGLVDRAKALFRSASALGKFAYEPHYNFALLSEKGGDIQTSYMMLQKALEIFPESADSQQLFKKVKSRLSSL